MPIIAGIKWNNSQLHRMGLTWDDQIPDNLKGVWKNNLEMIQELGTLKYKRSLFPPMLRLLTSPLSMQVMPVPT